MDLEYDLEEVKYTDGEEMEVIKEIRLGLMLNEINRNINKRQLIDWFARLQIQRKNWCDNITCNDLIHIARECGLKV
ncbi:hypothetical protein [Clostridium haemolyticum]|uniref:Uncharacterized protein n=1 Tax=Clostridium haemolyticum NCTC 9693 TaxID=1443114 RepID=A0ABR4TIC2_CLOHA|nr:hypothetical protein [Clostridium haemolyticum]KEI18262.1 hypothetical protein Z960_03875 [Clostridium haemolyticum NCTC 9693]KGN04187.1 hypothetical protein Z961_04360 [Clostridium haemolyticum NCTC 8350]